MKGKLRVEFIKSLGFMFAIGDEYEYESELLKVKIGFIIEDQDYLGWVNYKASLSARFIAHFADRINTDNKGHYGLDESFPIEWTSEDGIKYNTEVAGLRWDENLVSWKPDYDKLLELQNEHDDEIANKAISDDLDKIAESMGMLRLQEGEEPTLSSLEQLTSGSINWIEESQYALVGQGGEIVLCDHKPVEDGYFGLEVYTYFGRCYRKEYYTLIKREDKEAVKLTSNDIDWEDGMNYAVVKSSSQSLCAQHEEGYEYSLSSLDDNMYDFEGNKYNIDYYYIVKREEQSDNLIYTKEMHDKGESPKSGMKCVVNGIVYLCIGIDSRGHVVLEHSEGGGLIRLDRTNVDPVPTKQERIVKFNPWVLIPRLLC